MSTTMAKIMRDTKTKLPQTIKNIVKQIRYLIHIFNYTVKLKWS